MIIFVKAMVLRVLFLQIVVMLFVKAMVLTLLLSMVLFRWLENRRLKLKQRKFKDNLSPAFNINHGLPFHCLFKLDNKALVVICSSRIVRSPPSFQTGTVYAVGNLQPIKQKMGLDCYQSLDNYASVTQKDDVELHYDVSPSNLSVIDSQRCAYVAGFLMPGRASSDKLSFKGALFSYGDNDTLVAGLTIFGRPTDIKNGSHFLGQVEKSD